MAFGIKVFLLAALATLLVSVIPVSAGDGVVGVEAGDWVKYGEISVTHWSSPPWPAEQYLVDLNNTEWIMVEVQSVLETNVTAMKTSHLENGTEKTETLTWNITNLTWGTLWGTLNVFIIEANLSEGDSITPERLSLTDTVSRKYAGAIREVNRMNDTFSKGKYSASDVDAYWDKMTGVLCELRETEFIGHPLLGITNTTTRMKTIETNLWEPTPIWTESWFWVITLVIVAAVAVPAIWVWRRRKMPRHKEEIVSVPTL